MNIIKDLHAKANRIYNSELSWEDKYDLIFSENISMQVFAEIDLNYYDPDMDYEDDVRAFMKALNEKVEILVIEGLLE